MLIAGRQGTENKPNAKTKSNTQTPPEITLGDIKGSHKISSVAKFRNLFSRHRVDIKRHNDV